MPSKWIRIPVPIKEEIDRRNICAVLAENGLSVRIVKVKTTNRGTPRRFVEYLYDGFDKVIEE